MVDAEVHGEVLDIFWTGFCLTVEEGCYGYFFTAELGGDLFEGDLLFGFGFEEGYG